MDFCYRFPAVKGLQAGKPYYIAMIPLRLLGRLFGNDDEYVPPEYRAQRRLNTARIPVIKDYILDNRDSYVFSALAAAIDGEHEFVASDGSGDLGILEVSMDARFMIVDGQHRKASIIEAIGEDESLSTETISVVLYEDKGLEHSQQMFTDLNKHAVKTSNSIAELYDSRDALAVITRRVIGDIEFFNQYTDKEKDILGKFSSNFFTLNTFYKANKKILKRAECDDSTEEFLKRYWSAIAKHIVPWNELSNKVLSKVDLREQYIVTQAIIIQALGVLGNYYFMHSEVDLEQSVSIIANVDWLRSADCWKDRVIRANGKIINSTDAARLACNVIKMVIGIPLDNEDQSYEDKFIKGK
ncbi:MAG: DNA sulfur modification protein DndB [Ruminococcaceae bacterium]|nr:DNA sulfur modification protein DndB [Oscillospiraceae bacterium]